MGTVQGYENRYRASLLKIVNRKKEGGRLRKILLNFRKIIFF